MFCPFCGTEKTGPFTDEHFLADCLGWDLTIRVCEDCQRRSNREIDDPFARNGPVLIARLALGVQSRRGEIPSLRFPAAVGRTAEGHEVPVSSRITRDGVDVRVRSRTEIAEDGKTGSIRGAPEDVPAMIEAARERARREGKDLHVVGTSRHLVEDVEGEFPVSLSLFPRAVAKAALGMACHFLEQDYARTEIADRLRRLMWSSEPAEWPSLGLVGSAFPDVDDDIRHVGSIFSAGRGHVLALVPQDDGIAFVCNLFSTMPSIFRVADDASRYWTDSTSESVVVVCDAPRHQTTRFNLETFVHHRCQSEVGADS